MITGILGGSFNPPHRGHLALARTPLDRGLVQSVLLIPAAIPPHKATPTQASPETRLAMTRLLAEEDERLAVNDLELHREGPSYTIDTLTQLLSENPETQYRIIIGSDLAKTFDTWKEYRIILRRAPPLVAERPDDPFTNPDDFNPMPPEDKAAILAGRFPMPPEDVSSTRVRLLLEKNAGDDELLPYLTRPVLDYIRRHGLYKGSH